MFWILGSFAYPTITFYFLGADLEVGEGSIND